MEVALTPLEFARRTRALYADREAVVDGALRLTYAQFFERCDRWSAALQALGVRPGDRVAYIAPNTHAQLESFYSVPQIGAALVPINFRLTADDFAYLIHHSGARVVCAHSDFLDAGDRRRRRPSLPAPGRAEGGIRENRARVGERALCRSHRTNPPSQRPRGAPPRSPPRRARRHGGSATRRSHD